MVDRAPDIEKAVLGACFTDDDSHEYVIEKLNGSCFTGRNVAIFKTILEVGNDPITAESKLKEDDGYQDEVPEFMQAASFRVEEHCEILIEKHLMRQLSDLGREVLETTSEESDPYKIIDAVNRRLADIDAGVKGRTALTPSEIAERDKNKPIAEKLELGLRKLDEGIYADAMRRGQVELTIADSGHGKTQYALYKAERMLRQGYKVAWFQLEGYDSETAEYFDHLPQRDNIFICHSLYDIEDIKREARMLNRDEDIDYIVFDYVQNMECNSKDSRSQQVEYISQQITRLAKDLNAYCHPLSQVTIPYSTRSGWSQEPSYGDVRWSQQLKQDAHIITSVFRPSRIEKLVIDLENVEDWEGNAVPYHSVFIKQAKVRHGKQEWRRLHMVHTEDGLKPYSPREDPQPEPDQEFDGLPF